MPSYKEKQSKIEKIVEDFVQKDRDYIGMPECDQKNEVEILLSKLDEIFADNDSFRPHYFFMFYLLEKRDWNTLTQPLGFIKTIEELLLLQDITKFDESFVSINKYFSDNDFKYNVDMFISALKYELMVRKTTSKSEQEISQQQHLLSKYLDQPKKVLQKQIDDYSSTLDKHKDEFISKLVEAQETLKDAETKYADAVAKYVDAETKYVDAETKYNDTNSQLETATDAMAQTKNEMNSLTTNMLTILGVFVSIIFIIVGAYFTVTGEVFNKSISGIVQVNLGRFILMGQVLLNIIFLFMFMISRISEKNISVSCGGCPNSVCQDYQCGFLKRIVKRYPYVVYSNVLIISSYIVLLGWWIIETFAYPYIRSAIISFSTKHPDYFIIIVLASLLLFIIAPILILVYGFSKNKQEKSKNKEE